MKNLEPIGSVEGVSPLFTSKIDRNFDKLKVEPTIAQITVASYTLQETDSIYSLQVDATAAAVTVYLTSKPAGDRRRTITKSDSSANAVTVNGNGNLINGATTYALAAQYDSVTVEPTGSGWLVVASYP